MSMIVKNNLDAVQSLNILNKNTSALSESLQKVSSGMKIRSAKDGASEYSISEKMREHIRALNQANQNAQNGNALLKTAESAVLSTYDNLNSLKERILNAANDTNTGRDREILQKEIDQIIDQIDENVNTTYNGKYLMDGTRNFQGVATKSVYINMSLATDTTAGSVLSQLKDRAGETVEIQSTDKIVATVAQGNIGYDITVDGTKTIGAFTIPANSQGVPAMTAAFVDSNVGTTRGGNPVYTLDGENALVFQSAAAGLDGQISGVSFKVYDNEDNIKETSTAILNNFVEVIHAEDASEDNALRFHTGAKSNLLTAIGLKDMRSEALGLRHSSGSVISVLSKDKAESAIGVVDTAISRVIDQQTSVGAFQARLDYTSSILSIESENMSASESAIRDVDIAKEMMNYAASNVLMQASQLMLAQANQKSSNALSLLQ